MADTHRFTHADLGGWILRVAADQVDRSLNALLLEADRHDVDRPISFSFLSGVVRRGCDIILLDAGLSSGATVNALAALGFFPEDVAAVLITHQDLDHVGGLVTDRGELAFRNAKHVLPGSLWTAMHDDRFLGTLREPDAACLRALRDLSPDSIRPFGHAEVLPGITLLSSPGHRIGGHAAYEIAARAEPLLYVADAILHPVFVNDHPGPFGGDEQPQIGAWSRARLIERAISTRSLVFAAHAPWPGLGFIRTRNGDARWVPAPSAQDAGTA